MFGCLSPGPQVPDRQPNILGYICICHKLHYFNKFISQVIYWPPNSPDLNVIEHVWAQSVNEWEARHERTKPALQAHVQDVWRLWQANPQRITNLVNSIPARLQAVIDAVGGHTSY